MQLTKTRMQQAVWEGVITGASAQPDIEVRHLDALVEAQVTKTSEGWAVQIQIPPAAIADGVQTLVISETGSGQTLGAITFLAGEVLDEDIRVELDLLRTELDMLKRAFRQHCAQMG